jgi:hypothetical protein
LVTTARIAIIPQHHVVRRQETGEDHQHQAQRTARVRGRGKIAFIVRAPLEQRNTNPASGASPEALLGTRGANATPLASFTTPPAFSTLIVARGQDQLKLNQRELRRW